MPLPDFEKAFAEYLKSLNLGFSTRVYPVRIPEQNRIDEREQDCLVFTSDEYTWERVLSNRATTVEHTFTLRFFSYDSSIVRKMERDCIGAIDEYTGPIGSEGVPVQRIGIVRGGVDGWEPDKQMYVREMGVVVNYPRP